MKFFIFSAVVCLIAVPFSSVFGINEYNFELEEYLIYATAIDAWYAKDLDHRLVIRDYTSIFQIGRPIETELEYLKQQMPDLSEEMINDFKAKNLRTYSLAGFINQRLNYTLISQSEIDAIFAHNPYWDKYYQHYPGSGGILTLSRVGFNRQRNQAILHIANQWNRSSGAGVYVLLAKQKDGSWQVQNQKPAWYSWNRDEPQP